MTEPFSSPAHTGVAPEWQTGLSELQLSFGRHGTRLVEEELFKPAVGLQESTV